MGNDAGVTIVVACGAFKGSLTAIEAFHHAAAGARRAHPDTDVVVRPVADGGGGSLEVMVAGGARELRVPASGPTGEAVETSFAAIDPDTAFVEMADACGLLRLPGGRMRPLESSSRGVGEVLLAALRSGRGNIHLGIGGSAGGAPVASASSSACAIANSSSKKPPPISAATTPNSSRPIPSRPSSMQATRTTAWRSEKTSKMAPRCTCKSSTA